MKVLFSTQPGLGHLHPLIPIAQALQKAGHEVAFACGQSFSQRVASFGFDVFAAGMDWLESEAEKSFPELADGTVAQQDASWFINNVFTDVTALAMIPDLLALCQQWQPHILVRNDYEFASCIVAEKLGLPYATISVETFFSTMTWERLAGEQLAYLRSAYGLAPYPAADMLHRYLYLSFMPPGFELPAFATLSSARSLRPVLHDHIADEQLPAWIADLPEQPTIYATLGTVFNRETAVFKTLMSAVRDEPVNLIITVGGSQDPAALGSTPKNVYVERYIPQSLLLPHCDLAITHGGYQTMVSVLSHGLPTLTVPVAATDPIRALRCVELNIGLAARLPHIEPLLRNNGWLSTPTLQNGWLPFEADALRQGIQTLLNTPHYRQNAQQLQAELMALPGPEQAVTLLTQLVNVHY